MIGVLASRSTLFSGARRFVPALSSLSSPSFIHPAPLRFAPFSTTETEEPCKTGMCLDKMGKILVEYRKANYAQTLYSRFVKDIVAAADADGDGFITADEIRGILDNIGASDQMTVEEIEIVLVEAGADEDAHQIPVERVVEIMMEDRGPSVNSPNQ
mmetsp:Transcript_52314/g.157037  ORF Transcript_52314/g.157037 Transcript_52314/m.157037 type:complete len:157 (-) Transcript_52314:451-921(-)|eukprot:CAMPEP_0113559836 /NCGR_PEP_ID=MMETSP0015_2-20120614/19110_1 /TAXON_ID=2838 /ORGANISM="Odontella" /LENGTH=156 /DNA_ID=CAMNT_0000461501 /DNA_START=89 /DNA_END=559 /DNA_ORIENTATION=+ /assembly_acc=CAM_ASM_000160